MKFVDEFRDPQLARGLIGQIRSRSAKPARIMEFCGGHTETVFRYGIRQALPPHVEMVSGPGCPVCVTATADIDRAIALARLPGMIITTFGDLLKVPGSSSSLEKERAGGADIRMVYSTMEALEIARTNPNRSVIFLGIGFETTAPTVAASIVEAGRTGIGNYSVLSLHKLSPPVLRAILGSGQVKLDGLICPGHVSAIIGGDAWGPIARDFGIPCVVTGFEPTDVLQGVEMLIEQIETGRAEVEIGYRRGVLAAGNIHAQKLIAEIFAPGPALWRGVGEVADSGLHIRPSYRTFDATQRFAIKPEPTREPKGCICGAVLRGVQTPLDCRLFGEQCTPSYPVGPCMVSAEGSCAAYFKYGAHRDERL